MGARNLADPRRLLDCLRAEGFTIRAASGSLLVSPRARLTHDLRAAIIGCRADLLALLEPQRGTKQSESIAPALPTPGTIEARRREIRARLARWGWPANDAEATARRIVGRDSDDGRRTCTDCRHYRPGRCGNHRAAGLQSPDVGRDLAAMLQRCPAFLVVRAIQ